MMQLIAKAKKPTGEGVLIAFDIMDGGLVGALDLRLDRATGAASLVRLDINDDDRHQYALDALEALEAGYGKIKVELGGDTLPLLYARLRALNSTPHNRNQRDGCTKGGQECCLL